MKRKGKQIADSLRAIPERLAACAACDSGDCFSHPDLAKAAKPKKDEFDRLIELNLNWAELIPEVAHFTEADAVDGAKEFMIRLHIPEPTAAAPNPLWTKVLDQAKEVARKRAAELVGKRILKNGTIIDNPSAKWSITETTRGNLHDLVEQSIEEGWTNTELQKQILDSTDFAPSRALNIARTEKAYARSHGTHAAAKGTGMKFKSWLPDDEACEVCIANADQGRIPIDDNFESDDECVPAHPSDRCANGYYETSDGD